MAQVTPRSRAVTWVARLGWLGWLGAGALAHAAWVGWSQREADTEPVQTPAELANPASTCEPAPTCPPPAMPATEVAGTEIAAVAPPSDLPDLPEAPEADPEPEPTPAPTPRPAKPTLELPRMPGTNQLRAGAKWDDTRGAWALTRAYEIPAAQRQVSTFYRKVLDDEEMDVSVVRGAPDDEGGVAVFLKGRGTGEHAHITIRQEVDELQTRVRVIWRFYDGGTP